MCRFGAGGIFSALRTRRIVEALTRWPSLSSSPWIRWYPQPWFSVASRSMSATISVLTWRPSRPVRVRPLPGDQAAVPPEHGAGCDQPVHPQRSRQQADQRGEDRAVSPVQPGLGMVRRSTATSCRSTSSSTFFAAAERLSRTSHPQSRTKIR